MPTKHITIDTSSAEDSIPALPEPVSKPSPAPSVMEPPPPPPVASEPASNPKNLNIETPASTPGPKPAFALPYRIIYAVATQDAVLLYDTQQQTPICIVSNLHCAAFTDLTWSNDGLTLLISSSDGFCSTLSFSPGELGETYTGEVGPRKQSVVSGNAVSNHSTPVPTPTSAFAPPSPFRSGSQHRHRDSASSLTAASPPPTAFFVSQRPSSPTRTNSTSSVMTRDGILNNPSLTVGQVPSVAATNSGKVLGVPMTTPPETPRNTAAVPATVPSGVKRETSDSAAEDASAPKRRRIAPTLVPQESTDNNEPKQ